MNHSRTLRIIISLVLAGALVRIMWKPSKVRPPVPASEITDTITKFEGVEPREAVRFSFAKPGERRLHITAKEQIGLAVDGGTPDVGSSPKTFDWVRSVRKLGEDDTAWVELRDASHVVQSLKLTSRGTSTPITDAATGPAGLPALVAMLSTLPGDFPPQPIGLNARWESPAHEISSNGLTFIGTTRYSLVDRDATSVHVRSETALTSPTKSLDVLDGGGTADLKSAGGTMWLDAVIDTNDAAPRSLTFKMVLIMNGTVRGADASVGALTTYTVDISIKSD